MLIGFENTYFNSNLDVELLTALMLKKRRSKITKTAIIGYF